jgi:preprotein translocase subunit YajC
MINETLLTYVVLLLVFLIVLLIIWIIIEQRARMRYMKRLKMLKKSAEMKIIG